MRGVMKGAYLIATVGICVVLAIANNVSATVPYIIAERIAMSGNVQDPPKLSQDGRFVAFSTTSADIVSGDTNGKVDVFVRDRKLNSVVRATVSSEGDQLSGGYSGYTMSANGRFIVFGYLGNVTSDGSNSNYQLYIRDLVDNTTKLVTRSLTGGLSNANAAAEHMDISADGRYVVFPSLASNLTASDLNGKRDIFVRDMKTDTTTLLSKNSSGQSANGDSYIASISCDGSYVAFSSVATDIVSGDTNGSMDLFLVDRISGGNVMNITLNGDQGASSQSDISCNGERLILQSDSTNLVADDTNSKNDIFAYSIIDNEFQRVNVDSTGAQSSGPNHGPQIIAGGSLNFSGRYVVFREHSSSLVAGDTNGVPDIFIRDLVDHTTQIISKRSLSSQTTASSIQPSISLDGREVTFISSDNGLVSGDTGGMDVFIAKTGI